jgi:hypothetical protein
MSRMGLNEEGRKVVRELVQSGAEGGRVREAIRLRVRRTDYDSQSNIELTRWLRDRRYNDSAEYLAQYLEGNGR